MAKQNDNEKYNYALLRGWRRDQLQLLKELTEKPLISQTMISGASGLRPGSFEIGGKITALSRAKLIQKAGRDENGHLTWQLNEERVDRDQLRKFLDSINIASGLDKIKEIQSKQKDKK
ncbi:hypothetical protein A3D85_01835 [Candidatus Amesbacteria bacterium RIFCSPHIGHO2_02_FULL_47_9]|uniref:HTH arsR-type domain-containing protein n=1 Tax=Candidatus Amesbacteria bacterium RIFCSPHIGHO2_01_FULL_48_32b TaxID=1797253 RepID=A0A1F4YGL4_9BACT|nr:MAG: hypothetical protein A2876_01220 [Candidatus Amesbacteria bacterium RIFCSPHIGHO2_01_FULL_48_32b]OGD04499.1 MAG: hypothetical protein A3D85_01835 [Candidatus Amesbacteria bacterium RIFCSPHIGHO2_02_FULL_47_9]OGD08016.1 MAG: hypothetical protein A2899_00610 [Candidatus Amesbacteria bacterium RIFCSPLOWO2_01_FULL_49_25]